MEGGWKKKEDGDEDGDEDGQIDRGIYSRRTTLNYDNLGRASIYAIENEQRERFFKRETALCTESRVVTFLNKCTQFHGE